MATKYNKGELMNTSTKIFATLSMSAAVGEKITKTETDKSLLEAGENLRAAGYIATGAYPYPHLSKSKTNEIAEAVMRLLSSPMLPQEIISMLLAGLIDIRAKCRPERHKLLDPVIDAGQACLDLYADDIDHEVAWSRYQEWVK
jgi:hypothetical protein